MPIALVRAFVAMLPRLQAEDQLAAIEAGQLAWGAGEEDERKSRVRELERAALGGRRPKRAPASPEALAAAGIGRRIVGADGQALEVKHG